MTAIVPIPRTPIVIRPATRDDLTFIDRLQKMHSKMVGWIPTQQLEGKIAAGNVLMACRGKPCVRPGSSATQAEAAPTHPVAEEGEHEVRPYGYVIGQDQYFKRDDVGIIYQMNVAPGHQRG